MSIRIVEFKDEYGDSVFINSEYVSFVRPYLITVEGTITNGSYITFSGGGVSVNATPEEAAKKMWGDL